MMSLTHCYAMHCGYKRCVVQQKFMNKIGYALIGTPNTMVQLSNSYSDSDPMNLPPSKLTTQYDRLSWLSILFNFKSIACRL